jgi:magnesium transporter
MISVLTYKNKKVKKIEKAQIGQFLDVEKVWIDITNPESEDLQKLQDVFNIHSLTLEDIRDPDSRIKVEEFNEYSYVVTVACIEERGKRRGFEQLHFLIGEHFLITTSSGKRESFEKVKGNTELVAQLFDESPGVEYLAHHLMDREVDALFPYLASIEKQLDQFEQSALSEKRTSEIKPLFKLKKEIIDAKQDVLSLRDNARVLSTREVRFIDLETSAYFGDIYDHTIQLYEMVDGYRDLINSAIEIQLTTSSYRTNDIVRILTIITTLFMPLTFITGLYGMNFSVMPELESPYGYPVVLLVMVVIELSMVMYFWRKGWL